MDGLLKFLTCGNVDDGKSTLIGNLLYNAKLLYSDQIDALKLESSITNKNSTIDYSLLLDGLMAEKEQGITIDVAYRFFSTDKRSFIVADTPGHEQYTRNMAVGASFADLAVLLIDSTKGVQEQTMRHLRICKLMGIDYYIFAINKIDLSNYSKDVYNNITNDIKDITQNNNIKNFINIPVSATVGDNIVKKSKNTPWYKGKTLLNYLETIDTNYIVEKGNIFQVQRVCRPNSEFRGYQGPITCGQFHVGDIIVIYPNENKAKIKSILIGNKNSTKAYKDQSVTFELNKEIDISRGYVISKDVNLLFGNLFEVELLCTSDEKIYEGRSYVIKLGFQEVNIVINKVKYLIDINTGSKIASKTISKNDIAVCEINTALPIVYDKFVEHKQLGRFILIDKMSNNTCACGTIKHDLYRSNNIFTQNSSITKKQRYIQKNQKPITIWFTGLSGSGKSTLANQLDKYLYTNGYHSYILDGDNIRLGINKNLGFTKQDRIENIRRIAEIAKLMNEAGLICIVSAISPYSKDRLKAKEIIGKNNFFEIYVSTPLDICIKRDTKSLYKKAKQNKIKNFTGISSEYEVPKNPNLVIDTTNYNIKKSVNFIIKEIDNIIKLN